MGMLAHRTGSRPNVEVVLISGRIAVICVSGQLTFREVESVFALAEKILDENEAVRAMIFDASSLESFPPGAPIRGIAWVRTKAERIAAIGLVTRSRALVGVVNAAKLMIPAVQFVASETRGDAIAEVTRRLGRRGRRETGPRPVARRVSRRPVQDT